MRWDLLVIGGDATARDAALAAAQQGLSVAVVDWSTGDRPAMAARTLDAFAADIVAGAARARLADLHRIHASQQRRRAARWKNLITWGVELIDQPARFVACEELQLADGRRAAADRFLVSVGLRSGGAVTVQAARETGSIAGDDVAALRRVPERSAVLGSSLLATAWKQCLRALGSRIEIPSRSQADATSELLIDCRAWRAGTDGLGLSLAGVTTDTTGHVWCDRSGWTGAGNIWAAGTCVGFRWDGPSRVPGSPFEMSGDPVADRRFEWSCPQAV